jgi:hypothetical protein
MGQTIDMINNGEYVMGLAQERIHARSRRKTNIRTGPKAAGKGSSKGKKSPKETKRSKGAGKGSGSKKERRQRSFGFFLVALPAWTCTNIYHMITTACSGSAGRQGNCHKKKGRASCR